LCTYSNTSTPNKTATSLSNYFVSSDEYPGTIDFTYYSSDAIRVGCSNLSLYSKYNFAFNSPNYCIELTLISNVLKFTDSKNSIYTISIPFDFNCLTDTKIQYYSVSGTNVYIPDYLFIHSRNRMTDAEDRTKTPPTV
jgi:hypothetical protein